VFDWLRGARADWRAARALADHARRPSVPPPHAVKVRAVLGMASRFGLRTLVETGTFEGEMVRRCRRGFDRVVTIELDHGFAARAARRFAGDPGVEVWEGDSATVLPAALATVAGPALYWLDGHFSGAGTARGRTDTPLLAELDAIVARGVAADVVLVDDARELGHGDYPALDEIARRLAPLHPGGTIEVRDDIVRCLPRPDAAAREGAA
jgi:hypothetical protein